MNLILAEYAAQHRITEDARALETKRLVALTKGATTARRGFTVRLTRTAGWARLAGRGSSAA